MSAIPGDELFADRNRPPRALVHGDVQMPTDQ
jgi:hypothetical protein